ncbi:MAG: type II toxin-antitoxin system RelE/ParE family toxin [Nitrospinota bacterium]
MVSIKYYMGKDGKSPFKEWIGKLKDERAIAKIKVRIGRLREGNKGNCRSVGEGVQELRLMYGPGYRIYFGELGKEKVLLLCAGDKQNVKSQNKAVAKAKKYFADYKKSNK